MIIANSDTADPESDDGHTMTTNGARTGAVKRPMGRRFVLLAVAGGLLSVAIGLVAWIVIESRSRIPELTRADFDAALARWEKTQLHDYLIETTVVGRQPATYNVRIESDRVVSATRNGHPLKDQRTLGTWSIPGMFRTIEHDLLATEAPQDGADGMSRDLHLRAEFDPVWGYPQRYLRVEWGTDAQVSWTVDQFDESGRHEAMSE
jgi:hypothetical protein